MVKEYSNDIRNRVVGMILGGMSQTNVSRSLNVRALKERSLERAPFENTGAEAGARSYF